MEQPLDLLLELVGLLLADVVEPGLVVAGARVLQSLGERGVVDLVQLQIEEDDVRGDGGELLGDVAVELCALGIGLITGVVQPRKRSEPAHDLDKTLELLDREAERRAVAAELGELAVIGVLDAARSCGSVGEIARNLGRIGPGVEIGQAPFGQRAEIDSGIARFTLLLAGTERIELGRRAHIHSHS